MRANQNGTVDKTVDLTFSHGSHQFQQITHNRFGLQCASFAVALIFLGCLPEFLDVAIWISRVSKRKGDQGGGRGTKGGKKAINDQAPI